MGMSDWVSEPISEMQGAISLILNDATDIDYINIHMTEKDDTGYSRDLRIIVERKPKEGDNEFARSSDKERHPSRS